jgi:hypothetical protein
MLNYHLRGPHMWVRAMATPRYPSYQSYPVSGDVAGQPCLRWAGGLIRRPGPPGWGLGVRLTTLPCKKKFCWEPSGRRQGSCCGATDNVRTRNEASKFLFDAECFLRSCHFLHRREMTRLLWKPKVSRVLSQMNPLPTLTPRFLHIHFNVNRLGRSTGSVRTKLRYST